MDTKFTELYDTLGVDNSASDKEIKKGFRREVNKHHPDKGGDPEKFYAIVRAYNILRDEDKRKTYDQTGEIDDEPADTLQKEAEAEIINLFLDSIRKEAMTQSLGAKLMFLTDHIREVKENLAGANMDITKRLKKIVQLKNYSNGVRDRLEINGAKESVLSFVLDNEINILERESKTLERKLEVIKKAREIIKNYSYKTDLSWLDTKTIQQARNWRF